MLVSQEEADRLALDMCRRGLANSKEKTAGGQKLYNFGKKDCELHTFPPNDGPKKAEAKRKADEAKRTADEAEAMRLAEIEEAVKMAVEEERKRITVEEEERKRITAEEEEQRRQESERVVATKAKGGVKTKAVQLPTLVSTQTVSVDFNAEATKAARILGCQSPELKVMGTEAGDILYLAKCADTTSRTLRCDKTGLCLTK